MPLTDFGTGLSPVSFIRADYPGQVQVTKSSVWCAPVYEMTHHCSRHIQLGELLQVNARVVRVWPGGYY